MLRDAAGASAITGAPWLLAPAAAIVVTVIGVQLVIRGSEPAGRSRAGSPVRSPVW
jgi:ABC-type dipeptide/oligopeptide/nickel transport system permease subunit